MKNKIVLFIVIIISIFMVTGCGEENSNQEEIKEVISTMSITINEKEYTIYGNKNIGAFRTEFQHNQYISCVFVKEYH